MRSFKVCQKCKHFTISLNSKDPTAGVWKIIIKRVNSGFFDLNIINAQLNFRCEVKLPDKSNEYEYEMHEYDVNKESKIPSTCPYKAEHAVISQEFDDKSQIIWEDKS